MARLAPIVVFAVFTIVSPSAVAGLVTNMVVADAGTSTVYRMQVGTDINDYNVTAYDVPHLVEYTRDFDYDFVNDRIYILRPWSEVWSMNVNGTDAVMLAEFGTKQANSMAVDPYEGLVFVEVEDIGAETRLIRMSTTGGDRQTLRERRNWDVGAIGVDYERKYVYWMNWDLTGNIHRMLYNGTEEETVIHGDTAGLHFHALDVENNIFYGESYSGIHSYNMQERVDTRILGRRMGHPQSELVFDPKTQRLFFTNSKYFNQISVYKVLNENKAERLGIIEGFELTANMFKAVRVNPL